MEKFESNNLEKVECDREFITKKLNLVPDDEQSSERFLKLASYESASADNAEWQEKTHLDSTEKLASYFEGIMIEEPESILRPVGDTTYFTTAGVQRIETILREKEKLERKKFIVAQPSIRSQFMDKVKDGTSTSFVNFSVESIESNPDEFIDLCDKLIDLIHKQGVNIDDLRLTVEEDSVKWGARRFNNIGVTVYYKNIELGECVYIYDFPASEEEKVPITDLGFGIERLKWGIGQSSFYLVEFENIYKTHNTIDTNKITSALDPIRSMVLIAGAGVKGSQHDHGYRLRQFSKRFVERSRGLNFKAEELVHASIEYWKKWGYKPMLDKEEIAKIIQSENNRNIKGRH